MIAVEQAQAIVRAESARLGAEAVPLEAALGRVLAGDVASPVDLPPFDNSAMDGFALHTGGEPVATGREFDVRGEQAAGDAGHRADGEGAWEIMTGARMPDGLDAIVPVENVQVLARDAAGRPARIRLESPVAPGANLRRAGEDIPAGALAVPAATWLGPPQLMLLAGLGIARVEVLRRPRIAVLCTGRELVDDAARPLGPGEIRNTNAVFLRARLPGAGAELVHYETVTDEPDAFAAALRRATAAGVDIVLSTGAVSMGRYDFVPQVLDAAGARVLFHKVAMRPGKPLLFARLAEGPLFFGLPGNPVSSVVGLRFFVETALRVMLGLPNERSWRVPLLHDVAKKPGFRLHQKARLQLGPDARVGVELLKGQESFKTRPLLESAVWAALPAEADRLPRGSMVEVFAPGHEGGIFLGTQSA